MKFSLNQLVIAITAIACFSPTGFAAPMAIKGTGALPYPVGTVFGAVSSNDSSCMVPNVSINSTPIPTNYPWGFTTSNTPSTTSISVSLTVPTKDQSGTTCATPMTSLTPLSFTIPVSIPVSKGGVYYIIYFTNHENLACGGYSIGAEAFSIGVTYAGKTKKFLNPVPSTVSCSTLSAPVASFKYQGDTLHLYYNLMTLVPAAN